MNALQSDLPAPQNEGSVGAAESLSSCIAELRERMTRPMNDVVAMETSMLFMEEFMRRSAAPVEMLIDGLWPRHPFDDAVMRLSSFFAARFSEGGAFRQVAAQLAPVAKELLCRAGCGDADPMCVAEQAIYESAAEAIGGTSRAWANDAGERAADFTPIERAFARADCHAFDGCGGVVCCLNFATFLFRQRRAVVSSTPAQDAPFVWTRRDYEDFVVSVGARLAPLPERIADRSMDVCDVEGPAYADSVADFLRDCASNGFRCAVERLFDMGAGDFARFALIVPCSFGGQLPSPCLYRDPFALALEVAAALDGGFRDAAASVASGRSARSSMAFRARMRLLAMLTNMCCVDTGRENANGYCLRRCGDEIAVRF